MSFFPGGYFHNYRRLSLTFKDLNLSPFLKIPVSRSSAGRFCIVGGNSSCDIVLLASHHNVKAGGQLSSQFRTNAVTADQGLSLQILRVITRLRTTAANRLCLDNRDKGANISWEFPPQIQKVQCEYFTLILKKIITRSSISLLTEFGHLLERYKVDAKILGRCFSILVTYGV